MSAAESGGDEDQRTLRDLQQLLLHDLPLRGIPHIRKLYQMEHKGTIWSQERGTHPIKGVQRYETEGTNLLPILCHPDIDMRTASTNDVVEILEVLGIEACRQAVERRSMRWNRFRLHPESANSTAIQSSRSGWVGRSPSRPKSAGVPTMPRPK